MLLGYSSPLQYYKVVHQAHTQPFKTGCSTLQARVALPVVDTNVKTKKLCSPCLLLPSPHPTVLFLPGVVAPVALPAHAR